MDVSVLKVGGSLSRCPLKLRVLCLKIGVLSKKHRLIVVGGGGEFADVVREFDKRLCLTATAAHRMAILGMDQYGLVLSDLLPNAVATESIEKAQDMFDHGRLPVFLPSRLMFKENPLENSWDVTSDSIALYIARLLDACRVILITDVDGIYTDNPKVNSGAILLRKLSIDDLLALNKRTSVDRYLPKLLSQTSLDCYVVNGFYPQRLEAALEGKNDVYTKISNKPF